MDEGKEILEGFNAGYIIEKHRPDVAQQLVKVIEGVELPFVEGFVAGTEEYAKERTRAKSISRLKGMVQKTNRKSNRDKGRDDKTMDIEK